MYEELLKTLREEKIVAILRDVPLEKFEDTLNILKEEGIKILEITLNSKDVEKQFETFTAHWYGSEPEVTLSKSTQSSWLKP